jgi:hypothetical protein
MVKVSCVSQFMDDDIINETPRQLHQEVIKCDFFAARAAPPAAG